MALDDRLRVIDTGEVLVVGVPLVPQGPQGPVGPAGPANVWTDRLTLTSPTPTVDLTIPDGLRSLVLSWLARSASIAGALDTLFMRINGNAGTFYRTVFMQAAQGSVVGASSPSSSVAMIGYLDADGGDPDRMASGIVDFFSVDLGHAAWQFTNRSQPTGATQNYLAGGGEYSDVDPLTTIALTLETGSDFMAGSDFQLTGIKA